MNRIAFLVFPILLAAEAASADTTAGNKALALASLVAEHSPTLSPREKKVMARLFDGDLNFPFPADRTISVQADAVVCRASNVDITSRSCDLKFGTKRAALKARKAHELFATIAEVGVPEDGAAGSIFESLSRLTCTISPLNYEAPIREHLTVFCGSRLRPCGCRIVRIWRPCRNGDQNRPCLRRLECALAGALGYTGLRLRFFCPG